MCLGGNMKKYVLGFCFDALSSKVKLIRKLRPEWQANRLNGVGGKVEENETFDQAMIREFKEETGVDSSGWQHFLTMEGETPYDPTLWEVRVYRLFNSEIFNKTKSITDESLEDIEVKSLLGRTDLISNLYWLVPFARNPKDIILPVTIRYTK